MAAKKPLDLPGDKVIEITKPKTRAEEERFFLTFSGTQLNAVLLIILAATFLVQGVVRYFETIGRVDLLDPWFHIVIPAIIFLTLSTFSLALSNIIVSLNLKRIFHLVTFSSFVLGFFFFLLSLMFILFSI